MSDLDADVIVVGAGNAAMCAAIAANEQSKKNKTRRKVKDGKWERDERSE